MTNYTELKRKADNGDTMAQLNLAQAYFSGDVTGSSELGSGMHYMEMAANSGNTTIQHMYASMLSKLGLEDQAFAWYEKAANRNHAESQAKLALCYFSGAGTSKNDRLALMWAQKAFANGDENEACFILGVLHLQGKVVKTDGVQAYKMFKKAALNGHDDAFDAMVKLEREFPQLTKL